MTEQEWVNAAEKVLLGKTIIKCRYMTPADQQDLMWDHRPLVIWHAKASQKCIILLGPTIKLPPDLEKLIVLLDFELPTKDELTSVIDTLCKSNDRPMPDEQTLGKVLDALSGLTTTEAEDALALTIIETGTGQAGTGKSLTSQVCGSNFGIPTLRLDAGNIFASLVGESERNWRTAFATAKAIAPCVFWIDEVDGLTSGAASSGKTDGGTTNRVFKSILQDMQYNSHGIFFVFTANDIDAIPDPLIDRLKVWSVELPNAAEREAIWRIHIPKLREEQTEPTDISKFDLTYLSAATEGFSGRQIEDAWRKAIELAFNAGRTPSMEDCIDALSGFTPTSITMADQIDARRRRLAGKATNASTPTPTKTTNIRKLAA